MQEEATEVEEGKELVREVWEVIALKYADIRGGGFDQAKWAQLRDQALQKPLRDEAATYRCTCLQMLQVNNSPGPHLWPGTLQQSPPVSDVKLIMPSSCAVGLFERCCQTELQTASPVLCRVSSLPA